MNWSNCKYRIIPMMLVGTICVLAYLGVFGKYRTGVLLLVAILLAGFEFLSRRRSASEYDQENSEGNNRAESRDDD